jgi:hypothetical protein
MAQFQKLRYENITQNNADKQIRYWFPDRDVDDFYIELDWSDTEGSLIDAKPRKKLVDETTMKYLGWFYEAMLVPYTHPMPVPRWARRTY